MATPIASILIPHYNTPLELNLCLACLQQMTPGNTEIVVIDNGSPDAVLAALRLPPHARMLQRRQDSMDQAAHIAALDLGVAAAAGTYIVALHSDSFVLRADWLDFLVGKLADGYLIAGPDSHKLYRPSFVQRLREFFRPPRETVMVRPLLTIYDRAVFAHAKFADYPDVGGISVPFLAQGKAFVIPRHEASTYVFHLGGTTRLSNLKHRHKALCKKNRQFARFLARPDIRAIARSTGLVANEIEEPRAAP